ncbi:MAG: nucleoside deaminase [Chloroflexota bacterium]
MTTNKSSHEYWMRLALLEAEKAMVDGGEIPVAAILVSNGVELTRSQTMVKRHGNLSAHGELFSILNAKGKIWTAEHPLIIYTTLEPCLMCLGAAMQVGVDEIVYGMDAAPDGGTRFVDAIRGGGQTPPKITAHVLENESLELMKRLLVEFPNQSAAGYVKAMVDAYNKQ